MIVSGVNPARLEEASRQLGPDVLVRRADLRVRTDIDELIAKVREKFGHLDVLFANAGIGLAAPLEAVTEDQIDEQFSINFKGIFFAVQKAAPILANGGSIVADDVVSQRRRHSRALGPLGNEGGGTLAGAFSRRRTCPARYPRQCGEPRSDQHAVPQQARPIGKGTEEAAAGIEAQVPLRRFGEADEIAKAALFLASENSSFMTGAEVVVDGGLSHF